VTRPITRAGCCSIRGRSAASRNGSSRGRTRSSTIREHSSRRPGQTVKERFPNDLKPATDARELGVEKLKYKAWLKKMGVDVDDDDIERWLRRKADDNKTESQKRREGNIERLLRQYEEMMRRQLEGPHDNLESGNWRRPGPQDI
jgi:hypothetical protein